MSVVTLPSYRDPCDRCDALCCRIYQIDDPKNHSFFWIPIKDMRISCTHVDEHSGCSIYPHRVQQGYSVCLEYSCFWVWPLVWDWATRNWLIINKSTQPQENHHELISACLTKARIYVDFLLFWENIWDIRKQDQKAVDAILSSVEAVLKNIPSMSIWEIREAWDAHIYPKTSPTSADLARIKESKDSLLSRV